MQSRKAGQPKRENAKHIMRLNCNPHLVRSLNTKQAQNEILQSQSIIEIKHFQPEKC